MKDRRATFCRQYPCEVLLGEKLHFGQLTIACAAKIDRETGMSASLPGLDQGAQVLLLAMIAVRPSPATLDLWLSTAWQKLSIDSRITGLQKLIFETRDLRAVFQGGKTQNTLKMDLQILLNGEPRFFQLESESSFQPPNSVKDIQELLRACHKAGAHRLIDPRHDLQYDLK